MKPLHPGVDRSCPHCGGLGARVVKQGTRAVGERCSCVGPCPDCGDSGWIDAGDGPRPSRKRCPCGLLDQRIGRFTRAGIPGRHHRSTRATFDISSVEQTVVMQAVSGWLSNFDPQGDNRGLILWGDVGRGKTHLMIAALRELILLHGVDGRFVEFTLLLADIKSGFSLGQGTHERVQPLVTAEVLAIDELGKGRNTEFEGTVLDELISRRYNAALPILGTTNFAPEPATGRAEMSQADRALGKAPPTLADRVGARVYSRLEETCDFVQVRGPDYRSVMRQRRRRG